MGKILPKNKFEKLVYLFGFIIKICHDARSPERQIRKEKSTVKQTVQSLTIGKVELYDTHKANWKIRNEQLNCRYGSMKQKMGKAGYE